MVCYKPAFMCVLSQAPAVGILQAQAVRNTHATPEHYRGVERLTEQYRNRTSISQEISQPENPYLKSERSVKQSHRPPANEVDRQYIQPTVHAKGIHGLLVL